MTLLQTENVGKLKIDSVPAKTKGKLRKSLCASKESELTLKIIRNTVYPSIHLKGILIIFNNSSREYPWS